MSELKYESLPALMEENPELRPQIIRDCVVVLDQEVARKRGAMGMLIKGGFKVIKSLKGGKMVGNLIDWLLDEFMEALDPFYQEYRGLNEAERNGFANYLEKDPHKVAEALLSVTDKRRERASTKILIKTYDRLRPTALKHVEEGVPAVGQLVETYVEK